MSACDLIPEINKIKVIYNDIAPFLDAGEGNFLFRDFSEVLQVGYSTNEEDIKGVQVIKTNGKPYYFTIAYPNIGQMTPLLVKPLINGGQTVYALPVATWDGKPVTSNKQLYELINDYA